MAAVPDVTVKVRIDHDYLTSEQVTRGEALLLARKVIAGSNLLGAAAVDVFDVIRVAEFILDGFELEEPEGWASKIPAPVDPSPQERSPF